MNIEKRLMLLVDDSKLVLNDNIVVEKNRRTYRTVNIKTKEIKYFIHKKELLSFLKKNI